MRYFLYWYYGDIVFEGRNFDALFRGYPSRGCGCWAGTPQYHIEITKNECIFINARHNTYFT
uniref:Uncharacterized protein n=1 Tax=Picea glauca TaxID=3330 RepID=A0A101M2Q8_PICGL|nr:hypothetical protein ABT39_MTgene3116 [Picea glauca]